MGFTHFIVIIDIFFIDVVIRALRVVVAQLLLGRQVKHPENFRRQLSLRTSESYFPDLQIRKNR